MSKSFILLCCLLSSTAISCKKVEPFDAICNKPGEPGHLISRFSPDSLPKYYSENFSEGLLCVGKDNKWGYVNDEGKEVIPLKFKYASHFKNGIAEVTLEDSRNAKIDRTGNVVFIEKTFSELSSAEHLQEAKEIIHDFNKDSPSWQSILTAKKHLEKIKSGTIEDVESNKLKSEISDIERFLSSPAGRKITRQQMAEDLEVKWLRDLRIATDIKFSGKNKNIMQVYVSFQHDNTNKVVHDASLPNYAKQEGLKRIEFHDWSKFSKEIIYIDF